MLRRILSNLALSLLLFLSNSSGNSASQGAQSAPDGFNPGPDVIAGNMAGLYVDGVVGTQNGLAMGVTSCNTGNQVVSFAAMPNTNHPAIAQNLYRMSGGSSNDDRFEQIGQAWVKHTYGAEQANACFFSCQPGGDFNHLGVGCSDTYFNFQSATQSDLGSRARINPFTGIFQSDARDHTGHVHTAVSHMLVVESNDLNTTMNPGANYYAELLYVTPDEYAWCQTHPGECNMYNNASYLRYSVTGTTTFTFSQVGSAVQMTPAIGAWTGAAINPIEPVPGIDGRAFIAYKVTNPSAGVWHYEYAIYNQNLDRAIQSFSVPLGCGIAVTNLGFHAPQNPPGFPNDGTQGDAGFSNAAWTSNQAPDAVSWSSETFAQNQNANAIRWGTLYNFRFDSNKPPLAMNATVGFFKTGTPVTVGIQGPNACDAVPTPTPTPTPIPPTPTPTVTPCAETAFSENFDGVVAPALPPGWSGAWETSTTTPDTAPNNAFVDDPSFPSDKPLDSPSITISSALAQVSFRNSYNLEAGYDGGVLEVSSPNINAGAFTDVTDPAVGGSFLSGGYDGTIDGTGGSAIAGRQAWTGDSGGYKTTVVRLGPNVNGQTINLRFRMVSDVFQGGAGWHIDTVTSLGICLVPIPTPTPSPTPTATPTPTPTPTPSPAMLANISTRMRVGTGDNAMIGGFIVTGTQPKTVIVRGMGPSLPVPGALADPVIEVHGSSGALLATNDNWRDDPNQQHVIDSGIPPSNDLESALWGILNPGAYTVIVRGKNNTTGVALFEVYDVDPTVDSKLANVSTRGFVDTGDNVLIGGMILRGVNPARVLLRAIGPSLTSFGVPNALANPTLELHDGNGGLLASNDNWRSDQEAEIMATGIPPSNDLESAIVHSLIPGNYTAVVSGVNGTTGIAVVEAYGLH
jgi:hypothetical protein